MKLITADIAKKLARNGAKSANTEGGFDNIPVVKFFMPSGSATWLISESDPTDPDLLFGLCDLGMGKPEMGSVRLSEIMSVRGRFNLGAERDMHWSGSKPLTEYADAARAAGRIVS